MKQKIMEALLETSSPLTKEEIMWVATHLPDTKKKGKHSSNISSYHFNHAEDDLFKSICCTREDADQTAELLSEVTRDVAMKKNYRFSHAIEEVLEKSKTINGFFPLILSKMIRDTLEKAEKKMPKSIMDFLKMIEKEKGKRKDDDESEDGE